MEGVIKAALQDHLEVSRRLLDGQVPAIARIAEIVGDALRAGGKVVLFGNGGSAADAQHIAAELVNRFLQTRPALPAIALTTDTSILTAVGNDLGFEHTFARQVEALVRPGDVVIGISTSGNSPNVLRGVTAARAQGATTVGLTGADGGQLRGLVDLCLCVPSHSTPRIQEAHITVLHAVCEAVEREMFGQ